MRLIRPWIGPQRSENESDPIQTKKIGFNFGRNKQLFLTNAVFLAKNEKMSKRFKRHLIFFLQIKMRLFWDEFFVVLGFAANCICKIPRISARSVWYLLFTNQAVEKKILGEPGLKPGTAGWEARMLPLCYTASPIWDMLKTFPASQNIAGNKCFTPNWCWYWYW